MTFRKLSNASARDIVRYHHSLLADTVRTETYRTAINDSVREGDVVIDIGCGSGVLSFFAARAGAKRVYAIDEGPVIELARTLANDNGLADRITFINASSFDVALEEKADVIVTETMGNNGLDEQIVRAVDDARRRWLRDGGAIVPQSIQMIAAPADVILDDASFWLEPRYGIDFARTRDYAMNMVHAVEIDEDSLIDDGEVIAEVNLREANDGAVRGTGHFHARRDAVVTGIGVWFRAQLTPQLQVTNQPPNACRSWKHSFLPIASRVRVDRGDEIAIEIQTFDGIEWKWRVATSAVRVEQSTMNGFPLVSDP
jgi:precorrin-6B methylase 2